MPDVGKSGRVTSGHVFVALWCTKRDVMANVSKKNAFSVTTRQQEWWRYITFAIAVENEGALEASQLYSHPSWRFLRYEKVFHLTIRDKSLITCHTI